eukprot:gene9391-9471_t
MNQQHTDAPIITHYFDETVFENPEDHETEHFRLKVTQESTGQLLQVESFTENVSDGFCEAGCHIQQLAPYSHRINHNFDHAEPVVSCIILLTFNCFFVQHFLIPSIISNTTVPYEIIIVYNGIATDLSLFKNFSVIESETGWVSKGYNKGVEAARGQYVAIFHDDCLITLNGWQQPMITALISGAFAVSTESVHNPNLDIEFLKGTPLLIRKTDYEAIGGHDEFFFAGIEDLDFSYRIKLSGKNLQKTTIPYLHFNGMSTVILLSGQPDVMRTLFGYCLIPSPVIERWKNKYMSSPSTRQMMLSVHTENMNYLLHKVSAIERADGSNAVRLLTYAQYPALFNIRETYRNWLQQHFSKA